MKQLVEQRNDENSNLQDKVDSLDLENKVLIDTNLNLVKGFDVLENDFKMKIRKLVIFVLKIKWLFSIFNFFFSPKAIDY